VRAPPRTRGVPRVLLAVSLALACTPAATAAPVSPEPIPEVHQDPATAAACSNTRVRFLLTRFFQTRNAQDLDGFLALWDLQSPELQYVENIGESVAVDIRDPAELREHMRGRFRTSERFAIVHVQLHEEEGRDRNRAAPVAEFTRFLHGRGLRSHVKLVCADGAIVTIIHSSK
jgi:hypothetical protein